jgi:hypothetical protein
MPTICLRLPSHSPSRVSDRRAILSPLRMPETVSDENGESLFHFDCLLNGGEYGEPGNTTFRLVKADGDLGAAQETAVLGDSTLTVSQEPSDFPGTLHCSGNLLQPHRGLGP